jgi:TPP-dependent indolepyruvate ferredoxin oxidoreductase alpha subunit
MGGRHTPGCNSARNFNAVEGKRAIALIGDGGFWHNGLASSFGNAVGPDVSRCSNQLTTLLAYYLPPQ